MPCPFKGPKMFWAGANFLCQSKKIIYILWQLQKFCARQKDDLHSVKLVFVPVQKFLKRLLRQSNFWAGSNNLDWHKKFWDL